nr:MAG TPA: hypothetical protein [Caudoviricetes sp.]
MTFIRIFRSASISPASMFGSSICCCSRALGIMRKPCSIMV